MCFTPISGSFPNLQLTFYYLVGAFFDNAQTRKSIANTLFFVHFANEIANENANKKIPP